MTSLASLTRRDLARLPHFSWIFIVYHCDMSGKELELYSNLTRDAVLAFLIQIYILVQQTN